jgi:cysteinyl-tRNA synthetase
MLKLYNTLGRELQPFTPINPDEVTMYTCGPTVYDFAHIGNLRAYIFADILKRVLLFNGYNLKNVINITDVGHLTSDGDEGEDKIEKSAKLQSKSAWDIAKFYEEAFKSDLHKLNILEPTIWAKVTDHIDEQIDLIKKLEEKGFTYKINDGIYFDTSKFEKYGELALLNLEGQEESDRMTKNAEKNNPSDFALWKFSKEDEKRQMEWKSPWGVGFPGWHIECSAISMKYLGETLDIHTGGIDHIPVHHTNEIAQSESVTGKKFANYWLHNDYIVLNKEKMAKSKGNFTTLTTLEDKGIDPIAYRFFCLSSHYRSKLNYSDEAIENADHSWKKFKNKFLDLGQQKGNPDKGYLEKFTNFVNEDLSIPQAFALTSEILKSDLVDSDKRATILRFDKVFGFGLKDLKPEETQDIPKEVTDLADERMTARGNKRFDKADEIRDLITDMGWEVEDTPSGYRLKKL